MPELLNTPCAAAVAAGILRGALIGLHRRETHAALFLAALMLAGHAAVAMIVCGRLAPERNGNGLAARRARAAHRRLRRPGYMEGFVSWGAEPLWYPI